MKIQKVNNRVKQLETPIDYNYDSLKACKCDSCDYWSILSPSQSSSLFLGILIPIIWLINLFRIINCLYFTNSEPLAATAYLQIFKTKVRMKSNVPLTSHYIEYHNNNRVEMYSCLGHILAAMMIYGLVLFAIVMAFAKSTRVVIWPNNWICVLNRRELIYIMWKRIRLSLVEVKKRTYAEYDFLRVQDLNFQKEVKKIEKDPSLHIKFS